MACRVKIAAYVVIVLCVFSSNGAASAESIDADAALCERAIVEGARLTGVPQDILHAISLTETGRRQEGRLRPWPWAVNRAGEGHWFLNRDEAVDFAHKTLADGRTNFDTGCFQINYRWHGARFDNLEQMFDPIAGAVYAGMFLRDLYAETGSWSAAAGAYHSRTPENASLYRARFDRLLEGLGMAPPLVVPKVATGPERKIRSRLRQKTKPLIITIESREVLPDPGPMPVPMPAPPAEPGGVRAELTVFGTVLPVSAPILPPAPSL